MLDTSGVPTHHCCLFLHGVVIILMCTVPIGLQMIELTRFQKQQLGDSAYYVSNAAAVAQSLLSAVGLTVLGYMSQPHRVGRKRLMLFLTLLASGYSAVPIFTHNVWMIILAKTILQVFGGLYCVLNIIIAWTTDWCAPESKVKFFAVYSGAVFGGGALGTSIASTVLSSLGTMGLFTCAFCIQLACPIYIVIAFPGPWKRTLDVAASPSMSMPTLRSAAWRANAQKVMRDARGAIRYLWRAHHLVFMCYLMVSFVDTAVGDQAVLFLAKELHFAGYEQNLVITILGVSSIIVQCIVVPCATNCGLSQYMMFCIGVLATWGHVAVYAVATNPSTFYILEPLGAFACMATACASGILSGLPSTGVEPPDDQGILFGALNALKIIASSVSPIVSAALTSSWREFPFPLDVPGLGFCALCLLMAPAIPMSILAWCRNSRCGSACNEPQSVCA